MIGRFIAIVGPSGVGKDSVLSALVSDGAHRVLARRVITRPSALGGEDFEGVSDSAFDMRLARGDFALHWAAHGLRYGISCEVDSALAGGRDVFANLSRAVLPLAMARFARMHTIALTANRAVLARRLATRGREDAADIARRLDRGSNPLPAGITVKVIDNSGPLEHTVQAILDHLDATDAFPPQTSEVKS